MPLFGRRESISARQLRAPSIDDDLRWRQAAPRDFIPQALQIFCAVYRGGVIAASRTGDCLKSGSLTVLLENSYGQPGAQG
jgi:hypothetical protein